jgi:hypothetical protein
MKDNLIKIDTRDTRYYDFGKEMHTLRNGGVFSSFAKNTSADAIQHLKTNRGIASRDGYVYKFASIVDESVSEAYVFDRTLQMFPFVTDEESVIKHRLMDGNDPTIFSVGVHEVTPDINQDLLFTSLSHYKYLTPECRAGLVKIANELSIEYKANYNKLITLASIAAYLYVPVPKVLNFALACFVFYKKIITPFIKSKAFKELTKNSVIPITKETYTMSEIMSELRKMPKYKHGIHHIIVDSCFGGLTNSHQIEQVLKIQENEARMNVDVHESFYVDAKKIYDLSTDHRDIPPGSPVYSLLQRIKREKINIETDAPIEKATPFYKRVLCFFKPKRCILYQNNVTIETIIAICNITKLWLQILEHEPNYLDRKHKQYVESYNSKYMCSQSIDKAHIDRILRDGPSSSPATVEYDYDDPSIFLETVTTLQPQRLRDLIEKNIKRCIFFQSILDNIYDLLNTILADFALRIEIHENFENWIEYTTIFSRNYGLVSLSEKTSIIEKLGSAENKETLRIMTLPDYIDMDATTFVENELEIGNITEAECGQEYIDAKNLNFIRHVDIIFYAIAYDFNTRPIIYHVPGIGEADLGNEYWNSLLTEPLFIIFSRIVETLAQMGKFNYIIQH